MEKNEKAPRYQRATVASKEHLIAALPNQSEDILATLIGSTNLRSQVRDNNRLLSAHED
jgi:hypothetical protein